MNSFFLMLLIPFMTATQPTPDAVAEIEGALLRNDIVSAEKMLEEKLPDGLEKTKLLARLALLKNDKKTAEKHYCALVDMPDAPVEVKADAYAAIFRINAKKPPKVRLAICDEALKILPEKLPGRRMFIMQKAVALEELDKFQQAGETYHSLLLDIEEETPTNWELAKELYLKILREHSLPMQSELRAKYGASRILRATKHPALADQILWEIFNSPDISNLERGLCAVEITDQYAETWKPNEQKTRKKVEEFLRDKRIPQECKADIYVIMADYANRFSRHDEERRLLDQASKLNGLNRAQCLRILKRMIKNAEKLNREDEIYNLHRRIIFDNSISRSERMKSMYVVLRYLVRKENTKEQNNFLNNVARRNLRCSREEQARFHKFCADEKKAYQEEKEAERKAAELAKTQAETPVME